MNRQTKTGIQKQTGIKPLTNHKASKTYLTPPRSPILQQNPEENHPKFTHILPLTSKTRHALKEEKYNTYYASLHLFPLIYTIYMNTKEDGGEGDVTIGYIIRS